MKRKFLTLATAGLMASAALLAPASPAYAADTWCGTARDYKVTGTTKTSAKAEGRTLALRTYNSHVFAVIYGGASGDAVSMGWNYSGNDVSYWCGGTAARGRCGPPFRTARTPPSRRRCPSAR
ncbi:hypothetical protein ACVMYR_31100 [Micromonospora sp. PTRAS2]